MSDPFTIATKHWHRLHDSLKRRTKNAKAFHDKCGNMTLSDFYWG
ncbi:hypothetical protein ABLN73_10340 [Mycobacterium tuberculosis]